MEWSSELIFEFLDLYETQPALWNPKHPLHRNRNEIKDCWDKIQKDFSFECSVDVLKKKRDSLMATFRPLLAKVKKSEHSGTGTDEVFKPSWFAYAKMVGFLKPVYQARDTKDTEESNSDVQTNTDLTTANDKHDDTLDNKDENSTDRDPKTLDELETPDEIQTFKSPLQKGKRKRTLNNISTVEAQMADAFKIMKAACNKNAANDSGLQKDKCSIFGEMVASRLRDFDELSQATTMNQIDNLLFNAKMKQMAQTPPQPYTTIHPNTYATTLQAYTNNPPLRDSPTMSTTYTTESPSPSPSSSVTSHSYSETDQWYPSHMAGPISPNLTDATSVPPVSQDFTLLE